MVDAIKGYGIGARGSARAARGSRSFRLPEAPAAAEAQAMALSGPGAPLLPLPLTPEERDAAAARRGQALLAEITALQSALLAGRVPESSLRRLGALAEGEAGADPALRAILEGISLRARVELARLGR